MNVTRKDFIKSLGIGLGIAAVPAIGMATVPKCEPAKPKRKFVYSGFWQSAIGHTFGPVDSSIPLSYEEVVKHTAIELNRIGGLIKSGRAYPGAIYSHLVTIVEDGLDDKIYFVGENASIGPISNELNDKFICMFKYDVEDFLFRIKNGIA